LKRQSPVSTLFGAVPGALPPGSGQAATGGGLIGRRRGSFLIDFFAVPHFFAIAWIDRDR
jgi:heme O synthase-like polyprenyltransferase